LFTRKGKMKQASELTVIALAQSYEQPSMELDG